MFIMTGMSAKYASTAASTSVEFGKTVTLLAGATGAVLLAALVSAGTIDGTVELAVVVAKVESDNVELATCAKLGAGAATKPERTVKVMRVNQARARLSTMPLFYQMSYFAPLMSPQN